MSFFADQGQSSGNHEKHENQQQQSPDTVFAPRIAPPAPPPSADLSPAQSLGATPYQTNRPIYTIAREPRPLDRFGQPLLRSSMFQPSLPGTLSLGCIGKCVRCLHNTNIPGIDAVAKITATQ